MGAFTEGYIECALWSSSDGERESLQGLEVAPETAAKMAKDCEAFYVANADDLNAAARASEYLGHDFWLTRNRHGAGFWDGRIKDPASAARLTASAHAFGEVDLYVGDDGLVYQS